MGLSDVTRSIEDPEVLRSLQEALSSELEKVGSAHRLRKRTGSSPKLVRISSEEELQLLYGSEQAKRQSLKKNRRRSQTIEPFEVLRAIEKKDIMFLIDVRDRQFNLLVQPVGGTTPLVHAMRLGDSHKQVAIVLTGAISKKVNELTAEDVEEHHKETLALLFAIRSSLKLAIAHGLQSHNTDLIASYLQVLVMSEGDRWLRSAAQSVALALRQGPSGLPVQTARHILAKWVSRELKEGQIAAVRDYVANATSDLVLLGLSYWATDIIPTMSTVPTYFFARDDRILKSLQENINTVKSQHEYSKLPRLLQRQIETAFSILFTRAVTGAKKVDMLEEALDQESQL